MLSYSTCTRWTNTSLSFRRLMVWQGKPFRTFGSEAD